MGGSWPPLARVLGVLLAVLPVRAALAQERADADAEPQPSGQARVVFVLPELDAEADAQLRDALLAQFSLVEAELSFAAPRPMGRTQLERLSALHAQAERAGALAAFFLDVEPSGRWLLHVFDARRERLVLRPLDGSGAQRPAAIEAVAVMTRESTRALLEGQPVPLPPEPLPPEPAAAAAPPPAAPPPAPKPITPAPAAAERSWLRPRLSLGYVATTFGDESALRHGAALSLGQRLSDRVRVALGIELTPVLGYAASPPFEVQSVPVRGGLAGRMAESGALVLELEGVATVEWLLRHSLVPAPAGAASAVDANPDAVDIVIAAGLRAHGELRLGGVWALWIALGSDVLLNPFTYVAYQGQVRQELLSLYWVRLLGSLGLAVDL